MKNHRTNLYFKTITTYRLKRHPDTIQNNRLSKQLKNVRKPHDASEKNDLKT